MKTERVHFLKPTIAKVIIFFIPILILFILGFRTNAMGGALFALFSIGFIFCSSFWDCSSIVVTIGLITVYFGWYLISCLLVFGYRKIKNRKSEKSA